MGSRRYLLYTLHNAAMMCRQIDRCSVDAGTRPYTQHAPHSQYLRRAGRGVRQRRAPPSGGAGRAPGAAAGLRARGPLRGLLVDSGDWVTVERDLGVGGSRAHDCYFSPVRWFYISRSRGGAPATVGPAWARPPCFCTGTSTSSPCQRVRLRTRCSWSWCSRAASGGRETSMRTVSPIRRFQECAPLAA